MLLDARIDDHWTAVGISRLVALTGHGA